MTTARDSLIRLHAQRGNVLADALAGTPQGARLAALRSEALSAFEAMDVPTRRLERWKGTSLAALETMDFARIGPAAGEVAAGAATTVGSDADLVFVDGRVVVPANGRMGLGEGVRVLTLAEAAAAEPELLERFLGRLGEPKAESLLALQTALFEDAAVVVLSPRARAERAIHIRSIATAEGAPSACFPRILVVADRESEAAIRVESDTVGEAPGLTVLASEVHLAAGARVEWVELQSGHADRIHLTSHHARLERDARFDSHVLSLSHGLVRSELAVALAEPGAETQMRGFFLGRDRGHVDHYTTVDHEAPHCTSDEEYRGVLTDASKGVFRGRVVVRPGAQKTDARQSNPNLLLSDRATIDTKPQLEIYADDVRASHGSTIGQLDSEALFFLRARGIDERVARLVLTRAFAHGIVDAIGDDALRAEIGAHVDATLAELEATAEVSP